MAILFENNASGTLSVQAEIIHTTLTLQTNEGQLFPVPGAGEFFYVTLEDTSGNIEICQCTGNATDILTVTRAQENTTAKQFPVGSKVELRTTAASFDEFVQQSGDTMSGTLDMNGETLQDPVITSTGAALIQGVPIRASDNGTTNQIQVPSAGGDPTIGVETIWHTGNDGAGSGLDADTLDGVEGTGYIKPADDPVSVSGDWTHTGNTILDGPVTTADFGTGGQVKDGGDTARPIGFNVMPVSEQDGNYTLVLATNGGLLHKDTTGAADYTLPNDGDIPQGATWTVVCDVAASVGLFRIKGATGVTVKWFDQINNTVTSVTAGNGFTLDNGCVATIYKYADTTYFLWGGGITESV